MDLVEMYPAAVNSKVTVTLGVLNADSTIIEVLDGSVLPDAPNLLVLGSDQTAETVKLTAKEGNTLTVERGIQGNAIAWPAGTQVARNFTAKDWDDLVTNVATIVAKIMGLNAADVHARPDTWMPSVADVGALGYIGAIAENDDLNNYTTVGSYQCSASKASTIKNSPITDNAFHLHVLEATNGSADNSVIHIITTKKVSDDKIIMRKGYNGSYTAWKEVGDFKSDGSVPMSGDLWVINSSYAAEHPNSRLILEHTKGGKAGLYNRMSENAYGGIRVDPVADDSTDVVKALRFILKNTVISKEYVVFGEHNKELLSGEELSLTISSNVVMTAGIGIRYYKNADNDVRVHVSIDIENKNLQSYTVIGQLPVGYRPSDTSYFPSTTTSGGNAFIRIKANGEVAIDVKTETETETSSFVALAIFKAAN